MFISQTVQGKTISVIIRIQNSTDYTMIHFVLYARNRFMREGKQPKTVHSKVLCSVFDLVLVKETGGGIERKRERERERE